MGARKSSVPLRGQLANADHHQGCRRVLLAEEVQYRDSGGQKSPSEVHLPSMEIYGPWAILRCIMP